MCLIVFAYQMYPENDIILAANRDEFVARPTAPAGFWPEHPNLLAGRDLQAGGTWLGADRDGRFAAVTNFRDGFSEAKGKISRGSLPTDFLTGRLSPEDYARQVFERKDNYNGFNLLLADREALWYVSNRDESGPRRLLPGIYGLSNGLLNTPWPKVEKVKLDLVNLLTFSKLASNNLLKMMQSEERAAPEKLPDTGIPQEAEEALSSVFVRMPGYQTRSTSVLFRTEKNVIFTEKNHLDGTEKKFRI